LLGHGIGVKVRALIALATALLPALVLGQAEPPPVPGEAGVDVVVDLPAPGAAVTLSTFQEALAPYGRWMAVGSYGLVWRPDVPRGWRPYHDGHWEWTDEGWLWVSDEPWGWGPYHYGRWGWDAYYGWFWVPGTRWAPAWVTWRYGEEAIGWAPLGPGWSLYATSYPTFYSWWTFVPCRSFFGVPVPRVAFPPGQHPALFGRTAPAPPRAVAFGAAAPAWGGPNRAFVERRTGHPVPVSRIVPASSPQTAARGAGAPGGSVSVYRPARAGTGPPSGAAPIPAAHGPAVRVAAPAPGSAGRPAEPRSAASSAPGRSSAAVPAAGPRSAISAQAARPPGRTAVAPPAQAQPAGRAAPPRSGGQAGHGAAAAPGQAGGPRR